MKLKILRLGYTQTPRMKSKAPKIKTDKIDICLNELYCSNR